MQKFSLTFDSSLYWLTLIIFVFIPLYPKFPLLNVKGTFVAIRIEDFLILAALTVWVISLIRSGKIKEMLQDKLVQALLVFFVIGGISLISALLITHTITFQLGILHYFRRIELMLLLPLVISAVKTKQQIKTCLIVLSVVVFLVNIFALGQRYLNWPVISTTNSEFSKGLILYLTPGARVSSTFAGHYDLAIFLVMAIVLAVPLFFLAKGIFLKLYLIILSLFSSLVLVMTAARVSFIAVLIGIILSLLLTGKKIFIGLALAIAIIAAIYPSQLRDRFVSSITVFIQKSGPVYQPETQEQERRSSLNIPTLPHESTTNSAEMIKQAGIPSDIAPGEPTDYVDMAVSRSYDIRFKQEWPRAIRAFLKNPIFGTGYSSLGLATDNDFLRSLGEVGLLGIAAFSLIFVEIIKRIWKIYHSESKFMKYFAAGILSMVIVFLLNATFIDVFESSKIAALFWMMIGLCLSAEKMEK